MKRFEIWQSSHSEEWYWRLRARNGKIIADGGAYSNHYGALRAAKGVRGANKWPIVQLGPYTWQNRRLA